MGTAEQLNARLRPLVAGYYETHDEATLGRVLEVLRPVLLRFARHSLGLRDADRAQDLVQDVLLGLVLDLRQQRFTPGNFAGYVFTCCRHRYLDNLRSYAARTARPGADEDPFLLLGAAVATQPDELPLHVEAQAQASQQLAAATLAVLDLDPNARAAVVLHYYQGLPLAEAADQLGVSLGRYLSRLRRGLDALRSWAEGQPHPSGEVYATLPYLHTGDLFTQPLRLAG